MCIFFSWVHNHSTNLNEDALLQTLFDQQRAACAAQPYPSFDERVALLNTLSSLIQENKSALLQAMDEDFGGRHAIECTIGELIPTLEEIHYTQKRLKQWMRSSKRQVSALFRPAHAKVVYQPMGVVGIIVPFNYPIFLCMGPLITALAAGNRCMIKMSEFTPKTEQVLAELVARYFSPGWVTVVAGGHGAGEQFAALPFDHLMFTGSTAVGKKIMATAAANLTPVTLELGGKSPVIIDDDVSLEMAAERICFAKAFNAGQTCVAPDYVLIHPDRKASFIKKCLKRFNKLYPDAHSNQQYTSVINERHHQRLLSLLSDAQSKGAAIHPNEQVSSGSRRLPLKIVENVSDEMALMQEEIFGPLLPVVTVESFDAAMQYINARPRPLALYYFGHDKSRHKRLEQETHSGGLSINECLLHVAVSDLPFGGIGASGMGHYHGHEGFETFSKAKSVFSKGRVSTGRFIFPPYGGALQKKILQWFTR